MVNSGWSYSTGWPSSTRMDSITPLVSASMWFIIFMASTMHRVLPFFTVWPTSTKDGEDGEDLRSEDHTSELQSLMRTSYAVFCLKTKKLPFHTSKQTP